MALMHVCVCTRMYVHVHVCFLHSYTFLKHKFQMVICWDCHDLHHTVKKKKSLSAFGTVPSRPLLPFVYLFLAPGREPRTWCLLTYTTLLSHTSPQPFSQYLNYELVEDKLTFYWQNSYSKCITDSHSLR